MVMVAHLHCTCFDSEKTPSSLSKNAISYLRKELNFKGVIISDDMVMGAINKESKTKTALNAIKAGVNILLYRDSNEDTIKIIEELTELAKSDRELEKAIEDSYKRISVLKLNLD